MIEQGDGTVSDAGTGDAYLDDVLARLDQAISDVLGADVGALVRLDRPSTGLIAAGRAVEVARRRLAAFDVPYVTALEAGGEPARHGATSTAAYLAAQLKIPVGEAKARVLLAQACAAPARVLRAGPRTAAAGPGPGGGLGGSGDGGREPGAGDDPRPPGPPRRGRAVRR
jgi:Domain of unknown function (DUF222)